MVGARARQADGRDQASALQQVGFLPESVPTPHGRLRLPVAADQSATMLVDETTGEANFMLGPDWGVQPTEGGENGEAAHTGGHSNGREQPVLEQPALEV